VEGFFSARNGIKTPIKQKIALMLKRFIMGVIIP